jgi:hypothetical protein
MFSKPVPQYSVIPFTCSLERKVYRKNVLDIPGPVDRWLAINSRNPVLSDSFLNDYLMIKTAPSDYVQCFVEMEYGAVCHLTFITSLCINK